MKKILLPLIGLAALAACTKSEVQYEPAGEIGFAPVSKLNTKAAVDGTDYPDALNMFVFANAGETTDAFPAGYDEPYFANAEFIHAERTDLSDNIFGGKTPYYWPNVKKLIFSGYSKSGNVASLTTSPQYSYNQANSTWVIDIKGYNPGTGTNASGDNDLMWFPTTTSSYGKQTEAVEVVMKHACAWITINIKGDDVTGASGTTWKIKNLTVDTLSTSGDVTLGTEAAWSNLALAADYKIYALTTEYVDYTQLSSTDLVVIPQDTQTLNITYEYVSQPGTDPIIIEETKPVELTYTDDEGWKAGVHYIYNITIGTAEILIDPKVTEWTPEVTTEITL